MFVGECAYPWAVHNLLVFAIRLCGTLCVQRDVFLFFLVVRVVCGLQQGEPCERHRGLGLRCLKEDLELTELSRCPIYRLTGVHVSLDD